MNPYEVASEFKARGIGRQESWSRWVQATSLRPGMDAKDWYAIYDSVAATLPSVRTVNITATHYDTLIKCSVEIREDAHGVFLMRWADGHTGSNPPSLPPEAPRFVRL